MLRALTHRLALVTHGLRTIGAGALSRNTLRWMVDPEACAVDSGFDARHGTDTNGELTPGEAEVPRARRADATMYLPIMDGDLGAMLSALPWSAAQRRAATFVDLGSGKARAVLLAAMRPFREVVGVELSPVLHATATRNLAQVRPGGMLRAPVRLIHGDATEFEPPAGPLIYYLYHPFGEGVAAQVLARVEAALAAAPRAAAILYAHPTLQPPYAPAVFGRGGVFRPEVEGGRQTRRLRLGWSVWTDRAWLGARATSATSAARTA